MRHAAIRAAKQQIRQATAFGAGQPRRHKGIGQVEQIIAVERAAGHQHGDDGHAVARHLLQHGQVLRVAAAVAQRAGSANVAIALGIRGLADHRDHGIETSHVDGVCGLAEHHLGPHDAANARQDRLAHREVAVAVARALPGQAPAAGLVLQAVGTFANDQEALLAPERQDCTVVLQQHQRLAHGAPCQRTGF